MAPHYADAYLPSNGELIEPRPDLMHPLCGTSVWNWLRVLRENGGVGRKSFPQALVITVCALLTTGFRGFGRMVSYRRLARQTFRRPPVFILGHWRSGTTLVYELLRRDPAHGYVSWWHTLCPSFTTASRETARVLAWRVPKRRPMDDMPLGIHGPNEEEAAMAALSPLSFFHGFYFPRHADRHFRRGVLFEGIGERDLGRWKRLYRRFLQMVSAAADGRRIVVKNPCNTARLPVLLDLFPDAKFIHIYRNPYVVYPSTHRMRMKAIRHLALQPVRAHEVADHVFSAYRDLMGRYFETKDLVPEGNLVEMRFEDLEADPVGEIRSAYDALGLGGFDAARPRMQAYLDSMAGYRKNRYRLDAAMVGLIERHWGFAIDRWDYRVPPELVAPG